MHFVRLPNPHGERRARAEQSLSKEIVDESSDAFALLQRLAKASLRSGENFKSDRTQEVVGRSDAFLPMQLVPNAERARA